MAGIGDRQASHAVRLGSAVFEDPGRHRVVMDPAADNIRAISLYSSLGFRPVGVMRRYERNPDGTDRHDGLLMDLLAGELQ